MTIEIKEDGEDYDENTIVTGVLKGIMTGFRELVGGYRSHSTEDNLDKVINMDNANTSSELLQHKGTLSLSKFEYAYDFFQDQSFDTTLWDYSSSSSSNEEHYEDEYGRFYSLIDSSGQSVTGRNNRLIATNDLWEQYSTSDVFLYIDEFKEDNEGYCKIEIIDGSNTVELYSWSSDFSDNKIKISYDSSAQTMTVYENGSEVASDVDISSLDQTNKRLRTKIEIGSFSTAEIWISYVTAGTEGKYDTSSTHTYQTISFESTSSDIIGGILLYDEDPTQIPANTSLTAYVSCDGGSNWIEVKDNIFRIPKDQQSTDLKFKFDLSTTDADTTPKLNKWKYLYLTSINP